MQSNRHRGRRTVYQGIRMRSRLETRWARAFDAAGFRWEYEPECFAGPNGEYLPDFRLNGRIYVEIKPPLVEPEMFNIRGRMLIIRDSYPEAPLWLIHMQPEWTGGWAIDKLGTGDAEWNRIYVGVNWNEDDPLPFASGL